MALPNFTKLCRKKKILKAVGLDGFNVKNDTKVLLVTGDNASGKSFFRRVIQSLCYTHEPKIECIALSQEKRCEGGMIGALMFSSEGDQATGAISAHTFITGFRTSRGREHDHVLLWDEPELGLSEEAQLGCAQYLRAELEKDWPKHLLGLVLLTHSRIVANIINCMDGLQYVHLGGAYKDISGWLSREVKPVGPEAIGEISHTKFREICGLLNELKEENRKEDEAKERAR